MVAYPANEHTIREARQWGVQTMMFALNVADNGAFSVANADEYSARLQQQAETAEAELWQQCGGQLLAYVRGVFEWCKSAIKNP